MAKANPHYGAPGATLVVTSPKRQASVRRNVAVKVKVTGFRLDASKMGKAPVRGSGHLHYRLDGGRYDRPRYAGASGRLAVQLGVAGEYSPSAQESITYRHVPRGKHRLRISLANNDLSETGVEARVTFTVR
jgi:hypothetical protein